MLNKAVLIMLNRCRMQGIVQKNGMSNGFMYHMHGIDAINVINEYRHSTPGYIRTAHVNGVQHNSCLLSKIDSKYMVITVSIIVKHKTEECSYAVTFYKTEEAAMATIKSIITQLDWEYNLAIDEGRVNGRFVSTERRLTNDYQIQDFMTDEWFSLTKGL